MPHEYLFYMIAFLSSHYLITYFKKVYIKVKNIFHNIFKIILA